MRDTSTTIKPLSEFPVAADDTASRIASIGNLAANYQGYLIIWRPFGYGTGHLSRSIHRAFNGGRPVFSQHSSTSTLSNTSVLLYKSMISLRASAIFFG